MVRWNKREPLNVYLNSRIVGKLRRGNSGAIDFQYDDSWLNWEHNFPISFSLPLQEDRYVGDRVIAVFDNLLPDNMDIRRKIAERSNANGADAFSLLGAVGRDCVGALQFLPEEKTPGDPGIIEAHKASDIEIEKKLNNLASNPLGMDENEEFRISLAGVQEKTALLYWKKNWHFPSGATATTHILKPAIGLREDRIDLTESVENEHLCMQLVAALGLPTAKTEIATFGNKRVLIVKRFDRHWTKDGRLLRLPQEDCCQALSVPPSRKYENLGGPGIADLMKLFIASDDPAGDQKRIMKASIIFWLLAATDGHAKNFSLFNFSGGRISLTPFYDIMSVQPIYDAHQFSRKQLKMAMAIGNNRHYDINRILPRHFLQTAKMSGMGESIVYNILEEILNDNEKAIASTLSNLPNGFPEQLTDSIISGFKNRLQQLERHAGLV